MNRDMGKWNFSSETMYQVIANDIEKPLLDDREYRLIRLPNELNVLLIHDPSTDKAAAGLDVYVGSNKDKQYNTSGLAHFCEHLLFMGTSKYPSENEYSSYLSNHGGHSNAFTSFEHTNYYFEINADFLEGAIDRFAQFFINPLFSESCKDREINAVDSENKKNLQNDGWRLMQLEKSLSNPNHPYNSFSTGNLYTLGEEPTSKGLNVRDILLNFYDNSYSSNIMNLVVLGKESLDELATLAVDKFSAIKNKNLPPRPEYGATIYESEQLQKFSKVKSIMDVHKLELVFTIPDDQDTNWKYLPANYYSHLVGHESKGSIYYHLNQLGLVNELSCGPSKICSGSSVFYIECELTPKGLENYKEIIVKIFEYLKLVKSSEPQEWLFNELKQMNEINFKFKQKQNAASTVSRLSNSLYKFKSNIPPNYVFNHQAKIEFNPQAIKQYGDFLTPQNLRVSLSSKTLDGLPDKERWYGTSYDYSPLDANLVKQIKECSLDEHFKFPVKNSFVPENFEVFTPKSETPLEHPFLLKDTNKFNIWFKQDDRFTVPKLIINLFVHLPKSNDSIKSLVMTQLFSDLFDDELNDVGYYASMVGLEFHVNQWRDGLLIKVSGYNDKIATLLKEILSKLTTFAPSKDKFEIIKAKLLQDFKNFGFEVPYQQINTNFLTLVNERTYLTRNKIPVLETVTFDDFIPFAKGLFTSGFIESLLVGNINIDQLKKVSDLLAKNFEELPTIGSNIDEINKEIKLQSYTNEKGVAIVDLPLEDKDNVNSAIDYFIKIGHQLDYETRSLLELVNTIFHEPCFNQLRTKEQLGYVVFSGVRPVRNYLGYRILIQSERSTSYLRSRIENFLLLMKAKLEALTDEEFETYKKTLIDKKLTKLKNLNEESSRFWNAITDGYYDFKVNQKLVDHIQKLTKSNLLGFYDKYIDPNSKNANLAKVILNLNSFKAKYVNLQKIVDDKDPAVLEAIEAHQDDLEKLADAITSIKNESADFKGSLLKKLTTGINEFFPPSEGERVKFEDFKKLPTAGIPTPVEPLSNFHYTELHL